jgi:hypothetical protein
MVGQLLKTIYKYDSVKLASGVVVTAQEVYIVDGKIKHVNNGSVKVADKQFSFSINPFNHGMPEDKKEITYNLNNVPQGIDGQAILTEFVDFVEADIV